MFKKIQKVGETLPVGDLSLDDALIIETKQCICNNSYIMKVPDARIEHLPRFYSEFHYKCMGCNWQSPRFRTRTT